MKSYDYSHRKGVHNISWEQFVSLSEKLAEALSKESVSVIVGVARAGLFPATAVACMLRSELFPVRVSRRVNDQVISESPIWRVSLPEGYLSEKVVAVIDEIADSGETLAMVKERALKLGAKRVISAVLVSHTWASPKPDLSILSTDEFVVFPWDAKVLQDGVWQPHPEIMQGLALQK